MFIDSLGTVSVDLQPKWVFNGMCSSLTHLTFIDWTSPATQRVFVDVVPSLTRPDRSDDEWERVVRVQLPASATHIERRPGPVVIAELPASANGLVSRLAWVRGPRVVY